MFPELKFRSTMTNNTTTPGLSVTSSSGGKTPILEETSPNVQISETPGLKEFSFANLKVVTENFSPDNLLGEGAIGKLYKGWVDEKTLAPSSKSGIGKAITVKILDPEHCQSFEQWQCEVNFLGRHYHPNLISLLGYCWENELLAIVCEDMQKGSLDNHLFRRDSSFELLSWGIRLKIALGAARGLVFLHTLENKVIYRDFRTSNILLDENYNVKLSDFGLAIRGPRDERSCFKTTVMGTHGYVAPEYLTTGNLFIKSDVYSFGVVMLELLTGLMAFDKNRCRGQQDLVKWLKPKLSQKKKLKTIMDMHMDGHYSATAAFQVALLTQKCLDPDPQKRPSMKEVVEVLKQIEAMDPKETETSKVCISNIHHRSPTSVLKAPFLLSRSKSM